MSKEEVKKTATTQAAAAAPAGWEQEETGGFPPYWSPAPGKTFRGIVIARDARDPEFVRYIIKATAAIDCATGPADAQDVVHVAAGQQFTVSAYAALQLDDFAGVEVYVKAVGKREIKNGKQELWTFEVFVSPETKKLLASRRAEAEHQLPEAMRGE